MMTSLLQPPDWSAIDTCVLDMDGTLLDLHFDNQVWNERLPLRYAERVGITAATAHDYIRDQLAQTRGTLTWYCMAHWSREFGIEMSAIESELQALIAVRSGAREFLDCLCSHGIRLILATNAHRDSLTRKLALTGIGTYFDVIVSAHDFGVAKEHDSFWHTLAARHAIDPERTVFIDDNAAVLQAAQRFGIRHAFGVARPNSHGELVRHTQFFCLDDLLDVTAGISAATRGCAIDAPPAT